MTEAKTYHRQGEPGGPCCPLAILPVTGTTLDGQTVSAQLLDAGTQATEVELLRTIASRLGFRWGHDDLGWWAAAYNFEFPSWSVWRQDDSGNKFLMEANLTEAQAQALVTEFTAKGHKQTYWCKDMKVKETA